MEWVYWATLIAKCLWRGRRDSNPHSCDPTVKCQPQYIHKLAFTELYTPPVFTISSYSLKIKIWPVKATPLNFLVLALASQLKLWPTICLSDSDVLKWVLRSSHTSTIRPLIITSSCCPHQPSPYCPPERTLKDSACFGWKVFLPRGLVGVTAIGLSPVVLFYLSEGHQAALCKITYKRILCLDYPSVCPTKLFAHDIGVRTLL